MKRALSSVLLGAVVAMNLYAAQNPSDQQLIDRIKINRTLFLSEEHPGIDLRQLAAKRNGDLSYKIMDDKGFDTCPQCDPNDPETNSYFEATVKSSDLIAVGKVVRNISALSSNHSLVITDSQWMITDVWKALPLSTADAKPESEVTVVTIGGTVLLDGHKISLQQANTESLRTGHTYLLFLKYIPESHSYRYVETDIDGYDLSGSEVRPLDNGVSLPYPGLLPNPTKYLAALKVAVMRSLHSEAQ